jgi:hypothetical protein
LTANEAVLVATVAGTPIPLAHVEQRLAELRLGRIGRQIPPDGVGEAARLRRWVVQELVNRAVLVHEARNAGLITAALAGAESDGDRSPALSPEVVGRLFDHVTSHVVVPEADLRDYYERNIDLFRRPETRTLRYRITESMESARAPFDPTQAATSGVGGGRVRSGVMPVRRGELVGPLEEQVFAAALDDVVGPVEIEEGWMVARVVAIVAAKTVPFEEARDGIAAELSAVAQSRAFEDWIASRRQALAVIELDYEHPGHPVHGIPHHRH